MGRADSADLPDGKSEIFFREGLDDPNHLEIAEEIKFCAQWIFRALKRIHYSVMAGLVPAIHVFLAARLPRRGCPAQGRA
jgi:hypothetical protein